MPATPITPSELERVRDALGKAKRRAPVTLFAEQVSEMISFIESSAFGSDELRIFLQAKEFCTEFDCGRGIWKRIDENRELLQSLRERAPDVLERCPWIERMIFTQDTFLNGLLNVLALDKPVWMPMSFPRDWIGHHDCAEPTPASDSPGLSEDWVATCFEKAGSSDGQQNKGKQ